MRRPFAFLILPACVVVWLLAACESAPPERERPVDAGRRVVAVVGGDSIAAAQLAAYSALVPDDMKAGATPAETRRKLLETLIDKTLLLKEAHSLGLEKDPEFIGKIDEFRQSRILASYRRRHISSVVRVTPEEIEHHWRATYRHRALRFGGVMVATLEEALEVKSLLQAGAPLDKLAASRSLHESSAATGGRIDKYLPRDMVIPTIARAIFHLEVGTVSDPVPMEENGDVQFAVFKVLDEIESPLELSAATVKQELASGKLEARARALRDSLIAVYDARIDTDVVHLVARRAAAAVVAGESSVPLTAADSVRSICTYRAGQITTGEFLKAAVSLHAGPQTLADTAKIAILLRSNIIPVYLSLEEAYAEGLDRDPELLAALDRKRQGLLLSLLRYRQVDRHVSATDEEVRAYYETHPELFKKPEKTEIVEILVAEQSLAQRLKEQIEAGADAEALAREHTLREELREAGGRVDVNRAALGKFKEIFVSAQRMPIGSVIGPVVVHGGGYSVSKILRRTFLLPPYDEVRQRALAFLRIRKAKTGYVEYVQGLREKYPVEVFDEPVSTTASGTG